MFKYNFFVNLPNSVKILEGWFLLYFKLSLKVSSGTEKPIDWKSFTDCLRYNFHPTHFNLEDVLKLIDKIKPKNTILTNLSNEIDYNEIKKLLPKNVTPAHDGLTVLI